MKRLLVALALVAASLFSGSVCRADDTVITTSADGKTFTSDRAQIDEKGYTRHYVSSTTYVQATPAPTPVPAATNPSKAKARHELQQPVFTQPAAVVPVQAPVIVVNQTEAEMRAESLAGAARVKAQAAAEAVERKSRKAFVNGE